LQTVPATNMYMPGADCLLCIATAHAMNASLDNVVESWVPDDFSLVESQLVKKLQEKGVAVVPIDGDINLTSLPKYRSEVANSTKHNFSSLAEKYDINQLLFIEIKRIGVVRRYAAYVPTSDPLATIQGVAYLVDLTSNTYKWYMPINLYKAADGNWDEAPEFPGLTNAFFQLVETSREMILREF
ncbi:MAG: hypothetical protein GY777_22605, partial [Candidatus Brocadiaceae bacterium]|nr:hypothetical protein [Candidatus Brocadiaceae bacterium]